MRVHPPTAQECAGEQQGNQASLHRETNNKRIGLGEGPEEYLNKLSGKTRQFRRLNSQLEVEYYFLRRPISVVPSPGEVVSELGRAPSAG